MYSALKVNGKKLYEYAREGIMIERSARPVEISRLDCIKLYPPYFSLDIECSKGTYIRTLLEDISASMGTCACMTFLLRTRAGDFSIKDSHTLDEITDNPDKVLLPLETAVRKTGRLYVNDLQAFRITSGVRTTVKGTASGTYALYLADVFLGMVTVEDEIVKPEKILVQVNKPKEPV
jgi:tRNA pseudouridine55 synthase